MDETKRFFLDAYQEIENTQSQHLKGDTRMTVIVEPIKNFDT